MTVVRQQWACEMKSVLRSSILGMLFAGVGAYSFGLALFLFPLLLNLGYAPSDGRLIKELFIAAFLPYQAFAPAWWVILAAGALLGVVIAHVARRTSPLGAAAAGAILAILTAPPLTFFVCRALGVPTFYIWMFFVACVMAPFGAAYGLLASALEKGKGKACAA